jgi:hypothetical protein
MSERRARCAAVSSRVAGRAAIADRLHFIAAVFVFYFLPASIENALYETITFSRRFRQRAFFFLFFEKILVFAFEFCIEPDNLIRGLRRESQENSGKGEKKGAGSNESDPLYSSRHPKRRANEHDCHQNAPCDKTYVGGFE